MSGVRVSNSTIDYETIGKAELYMQAGESFRAVEQESVSRQRALTPG